MDLDEPATTMSGVSLSRWALQPPQAVLCRERQRRWRRDRPVRTMMAPMTERTMQDTGGAHPASVLALTMEVASAGESRVGRGRHRGGGGRFVGLSRAPASGRRHHWCGNLWVGAWARSTSWLAPSERGLRHGELRAGAAAARLAAGGQRWGGGRRNHRSGFLLCSVDSR